MARPLRSARHAEEGGHAPPAFVLPRRVRPHFLAYAFLAAAFHDLCSLSLAERRRIREEQLPRAILFSPRRQGRQGEAWIFLQRLFTAFHDLCSLSFAERRRIREEQLPRDILFSPSRQGRQGEAWIFLQRLFTAFHDLCLLSLA